MNMLFESDKCALAHSEISTTGAKCVRCGSSNPARKPKYIGLEMVIPVAMHEHGLNMTVAIPICPGTCPAFVPIRSHHAHLKDDSEKI